MGPLGRPSIVLVQPPAFSCSPSNALALLKAHLKTRGLRAAVRDSSLSVWDFCRERHGLRPQDWTTESAPQFHARLEADPAATEAALDAEARWIAGENPDLVGFSLQTLTDEYGLRLAEKVKTLAPGTCIVVGGPQCLRETLAYELIRHPAVDAVALGEADRSFVSFVDRFDVASRIAPRTRGLLVKERDGVVDGGDPLEIEDLDELPFQDFGGFDLERYPRVLRLATTRGCVRKCSFCTHILQQKTFRFMSAGRIASEIRHQLATFRAAHVEFGDSLINGSVARLAELSEKLVELRVERAAARQSDDLTWAGMAILHPTMTAALLRRMRLGGCRKLSYGLESASQKVVDLMGKGFRVSDAEAVVRATADAGIYVSLFVMVGFPGETEDDFRQTLDFLRRNRSSIFGLDISACEIQRGSELDLSRARRGVIFPGGDRRGWFCHDGSNDPDVRERRYKEVLALAGRLGIHSNREPAERASDLEYDLAP